MGSRTNASNDSAMPSPIPFQKKAIKYENDQELQLALANWKIAEALLKERILSITKHIEENAEKHYQNGLTYMQKGQVDLATTEFLKTLWFDPSHREVMDALKNIGPSRTLTYTIRPGDTFTSIAEHVYKNRDQSCIVSYFSGVDLESDLKPGNELTLPVLELGLTKRFFNYQKEITEARDFFKKKEFKKALQVAENIHKHMPDNEEAMFIINSSYDALAEELEKKQKYESAIELLEKIDPKFKSVKNRIQHIRDILARKREAVTENKNATHYQAGLNFLDQKQYLKALEALEKVELSYGDVKMKLAELKELMTAESEMHYRNGVKFFLDEKLEEAIGEWEIALALAPENVKAQKDIDNAKQLLKKINEIN